MAHFGPVLGYRGLVGRWSGIQQIPGAFRREIDTKYIWMKVRDAIKRIESDGWKLARTRGSHRQYQHSTKPGTVTIAGHPSADLAPKTEKSILKQAGLE